MEESRPEFRTGCCSLALERRRHIGRWPIGAAILAALVSVCAAAFGEAGQTTDAPKGSAPVPRGMFLKFPDWVASIAFSSNGRTVAAGSYGVVKLFDVEEMRELESLTDTSGFVRAVAFTRDGSGLIVGGYQTVSLRSLAERKVIRVMKGHRGYVTSVSVSPDGTILATASDDESVRLWKLPDGELLRSIEDLGQPVLAVAFSPDGRNIAVGMGDPTRPTKKGSARIFDLEGQQLAQIDGHDRSVAAIAFSPDGALLATGSADETIRLWSAPDGKAIRSLEGHTRPVNTVAFLPHESGLVSGSGGRNTGGNEVRLWDSGTGKTRATVPAHSGPVMQVAVSPDGRWLATAGYDKSVKIWEVAALARAAPAEKDAGAKTAVVNDQIAAGAEKVLRAGIIGLDTSHSVAFTKLLNDDKSKDHVPGCRVVAAYPKGSPDIASSVSRVPGYMKEVQELGVEIVDSIDDLVQKVDVVLLETNDGRPHLEQVLPVLKAGKTVFIDKPIAGSLADAVAIFEAAKKYKVPVFSASSLRYAEGAQALRKGKVGEIRGCDAYSPCSLEATHPDFYWYGIHGVETLFTVMGAGCETVTRVNSPGIDVAVGAWKGGRVGTFRGIRDDQGGGRADYGGTAFGTQGIAQIGPYGGYRPLVVEIVNFFKSGKSPVADDETLEIYAFMEAADESKRQGGVPVSLEAVLKKAHSAAAERLAALDK